MVLIHLRSNLWHSLWKGNSAKQDIKLNKVMLDGTLLLEILQVCNGSPYPVSKVINSKCKFHRTNYIF